MYEAEILNLFKCMVASGVKGRNCIDINYGVVTNFTPTDSQRAVLRAVFKPLDIHTLFSVEERENNSPEQLIYKQILNYIETYALQEPGLFNLEVTDGKIITINYVKGILVCELNEKLQKLLYTNAPVKDAVLIKNLVNHFNTTYDIALVQNNELRTILFDMKTDRFNNGDDVVRYICYLATGNSLLIKSKEVIDAVKGIKFSNDFHIFLQNHKTVLAQVFNRHKPLLLALKRAGNASTINEISRLSKTKHVPVHEAFSKRFISSALNGNVASFAVLDDMSVRDRFKFLNLLEHKKTQNTEDVFVIRNGRSHLEPNRPVYNSEDVNQVINQVVNSLVNSLRHLKEKNILLDPNVDYGLPISRKQVLGNLPFGTRIRVESDEISAGIYWENDWGATDLDLSAVDEHGKRTGWGGYGAYSNSNPITFSGDVTYAPNGAMEFMTSKTSYKDAYGLIVNSYSGTSNAGMELVIGSKAEGHWIKDVLIREKTTLPGRGAMLGFVKNGNFIVYAPAISISHISSPKNVNVVRRGLSNFWTVTDLLDYVGVHYDLNRKEGKKYDHDLSYSNFSLDKLEELF